MSNLRAFRPGRLQFGGGGKKEYIIAAGLGLVIILALIVAIYSATGGTEGGRISGQARWYCFDCKADFTLPEDYDDLSSPDPNRVVCPKCKQLRTVPMRRCPKCENWFLPTYDKRTGEMTKAECSKCGTDLRKWYQDEMSR